MKTGLGEQPEIIPALPLHSLKFPFCYKFLPQWGSHTFGIFCYGSVNQLALRAKERKKICNPPNKSQPSEDVFIYFSVGEKYSWAQRLLSNITSWMGLFVFSFYFLYFQVLKGIMKTQAQQHHLEEVVILQSLGSDTSAKCTCT